MGICWLTSKVLSASKGFVFNSRGQCVDLLVGPQTLPYSTSCVRSSQHHLVTTCTASDCTVNAVRSASFTCFRRVFVCSFILLVCLQVLSRSRLRDRSSQHCERSTWGFRRLALKHFRVPRHVFVQAKCGAFLFEVGRARGSEVFAFLCPIEDG